MFPLYPSNELVVQKLERLTEVRSHVCRKVGIKSAGLEHDIRTEVLSIKRRIHSRRQPDETATNAFAERQTQLQLGGGLVDLVNHQSVLRENQITLKPPAGDPSRNDHHAPRRRFRRGFPFAIHHANPQRQTHDLLGNRTNAERLPRPRPRHDPETQSSTSQLSHLVAVLALEHRLDVQVQRKLDGFTRRARGSDDDYSSRLGFGATKRLLIGGEVVVANTVGRCH